MHGHTRIKFLISDLLQDFSKDLGTSSEFRLLDSDVMWTYLVAARKISLSG